ncbi:methyl-accepting chemotaxis protein [Litorilituus lipolyticus]|uniref:Methyl-accepting chemotaxis protein n=1 Tax=Litorilituus lipolyticus TaxID=2491017 RepID=A0A502KLK7_9GAMM|nr:methyl-accepting chemotaxis protein [Litorilituus lipolyticus]TPH12490.1 methyl-accepting chemotaxis protein [Litorilituus lipolyticus]
MSILTPAIALSNKLKFKFKFLLLGIIFYIPLMGMCLWVINGLVTNINAYQLELTGYDYLKRLNQIEHQLSQGQTASIEQLTSELGEDPLFNNAMNSLNELQQWQAMKEESGEFDFYLHTIALKENISAATGLARENDAISFYLNQIISLRLPSLLEYLTKLSSTSDRVIRDGFDAQSYTLIVALDKRVDEIQNQLNKSVNLLKLHGEDSQAILQFSSNYELLTQNLDEFQRTLRSQVIEPDEISLSQPQAMQQSSEILINGRALLNSSEQMLFEALTHLKASSDTVLYLISAILLLVTLLSIYFLVAMYQSLSDNVYAITLAAEQLGNGNFDQTLVASSQDEFGKISDSFSQMQHKIASLLALLNTDAKVLTEAANDIQLLTTNMENSISEQQQNTHSVATAISQMSNSIAVVHHNTEQAKGITEQASENVQQGQSVIKDTEMAIDAIALEVNNSATVINELAENSTNITQFVSVIREIAEQTNLLALNAAIEAARAGEQGRGFAVVADEVRTLAGRTQDATTEIQLIIEKLQLGANKSVEVMNAGVEKANAGVEQAQLVATTFSDVTVNVTDIVNASGEISSAVNEQNQMVESININTENIATGADEVANAARTTADAGVKLSTIVEQLSRQLAQFKLAK